MKRKKEKMYRIGELAKLANVSPRTIDYYTRIGLINVKKRSRSNYRYYGSETLEQLRRIDYMKKEKYTLEEIKSVMTTLGKLPSEDELAEKLTSLQVHLQQLEREVKELSPVIDGLKPQEASHVFRLLTPHTAACVEALLLLLGKGPIL